MVLLILFILIGWSGGKSTRHTSIGVRCELVWSATFLRRTTTSKRSLESSRLGEFECEISPGYDVIQKNTAFHKSSTKAVAWNHPQKVWTTTFLRWNSTSHTSLESSWSWKLKYAVSAGWAKRKKNYRSLNFWKKTWKISLKWALSSASRGIDNFS